MSDTSGDKARPKGITVTCIACDRVIKVPVERAGTRGRCPKCGAVVEIPSLDGSPVVRGHTRAIVPQVDVPAPKVGAPPKGESSRRATAKPGGAPRSGTGKVEAPSPAPRTAPRKIDPPAAEAPVRAAAKAAAVTKATDKVAPAASRAGTSRRAATPLPRGNAKAPPDDDEADDAPVDEDEEAPVHHEDEDDAPDEDEDDAPDEDEDDAPDEDEDDAPDEDEDDAPDEDEDDAPRPRAKAQRRRDDDDEPRMLHGAKGRSSFGFYLILLLMVVAMGVAVAAGGYYLLDTGDPAETARRYYAAIQAGDEAGARACVVIKQAKAYMLLPEDKDQLAGASITYGDLSVSSKTARIKIEIKLPSGVKQNKIVALVREDVLGGTAWLPQREWRVDQDASDRESQAIAGQ